MPNKLRELRLLPMLLLCALPVLLILNLSGHPDDGPTPLPAGEQIAAFSLGLFSDFNADAVRPREPGKPVAAFPIRPDENFKTIGCLARFRLATGGNFPLFFFFYRGNTLQASRSLWINPADTACLATLTLPRSAEGHWSIDICLNNNLLLKTISFEIVKAPETGRFRSLHTTQDGP